MGHLQLEWQVPQTIMLNYPEGEVEVQDEKHKIDFIDTVELEIGSSI